MSNRILEILTISRHNGLTKEEVYKKLGYTNLSFEDFEDAFEKMIEEHQIYQTGKDKYIRNPFEEGEVKVNKKGEVFVKCDDITISVEKNTFNCITGDIVKVKITDFDEKRGTLKEVVKRAGQSAEVITEKGVRYAVLKNGMKYKIRLDEKIVDGTIIGIKIENTKKNKEPVAVLDRIIGHKNEPRSDDKAILYANGFEYEWNDEIKDELLLIPSTITEEEIKGRRDLRDKTIFTIDGDDTKDIDDAISLEKLPNGNYKLGVHIADVSNYVKYGTAIFREAYERGTSVYMNTVVNPELPVELSNGICSLNPDVDRLALTFDMEITPKGKVAKLDMYESVIRSRKQMTYKNVNKILEENEIPEDYKEFSDTLKLMNDLRLILEKNRISRGYQNFEIPEQKINTDENGVPTEMLRREQRSGEKLIEQFMLIANESVATHFYNLGIPFMYRDHDVLNEDRLRHVVSVMTEYGEKINIKEKFGTSKYLQQLLKSLEDSKRKEVFSEMLVRCLDKADYREYNIGHFSIGIDEVKREAYGQVTSPIRRLPDLINHMIIKAHLNNNNEYLYSDEFKEAMKKVGIQSSNREVAADECERQSNKMKSAEYMQNYIGEEYQAMIVGFTEKGGMYVRLPNLIEGRVGYESMNDHYGYNPETEVLIGQRGKKIYRLGDIIPVKLVRASKEQSEIDFEIIEPKVRTRKK